MQRVRRAHHPRRRPRGARLRGGLELDGRVGARLCAPRAKVANTAAVLEEAGRRYWAPRRYRTLHRGITAKDYGQAVPVVVTTLEQLQEHGADAAVWRRLGRKGEQTLTAALDNPDSDVLFRDQEARADAQEGGAGW
ncbi:hypothetical protein [Streptomyces sp. NPDC052042]|uniref:hypothetical protein n=1 Tax=Streptomyces sp. NPDC052042 TaxID=3365683 RepID=UPI0037D05CC0